MRMGWRTAVTRVQRIVFGFGTKIDQQVGARVRDSCSCTAGIPTSLEHDQCWVLLVGVYLCSTWSRAASSLRLVLPSAPHGPKNKEMESPQLETSGVAWGVALRSQLRYYYCRYFPQHGSCVVTELAANTLTT